MINQSVDPPAGGQVVFTVDGTVANGTTGTLTDSATAEVAAPAIDPNPSNIGVGHTGRSCRKRMSRLRSWLIQLDTPPVPN